MMSAMKRLLLIAALAAVLLFPAPSAPLSVRAEETERYAVAAREDVWFYSAENEESGLFLIPYTYYVKVLREGTLYTAVQYLDDVSPYRAVTGFCKTELLTFVDFVPVRPYLRREITVTYTISGEKQLGGGAFDHLEKRFVYYGTSYAGTARYFYVYADGVFDYVPATQDVFFELNTDYLTQTSGEAEEPPPSEEPSSAPSAVQIIAICAACLAVLAIGALVIRGKRPQAVSEEF